MKIYHLYLCFVSIACAEPVFQSHQGKGKGSCIEHYKKEEENNQSNVSTHLFYKRKKLTRPSEEGSKIQERGEDQKHIAENGIGRMSENKSISNSRQKFTGDNENTHHHYLEVHKDNTGVAPGNITDDTEGSGDLDFLDEVSINDYHARDSGCQDARGTGHMGVSVMDNKKDETGATSNNEPERSGYNDPREKDKAKDSDDSRESSKKDKATSQDPESTGYSDQDREPSNEGSGYTGFLEKEENVVTSNGNAHHGIRDSSSTDIPEIMKDGRTDAEGTKDDTYLPHTNKVKRIKGKFSSHMERPGFTKEHKRGEVNIFSGRTINCVEKSDATEAHKKDKGGRASRQRVRLGSPKKHNAENNIPCRKVSSHIQEPDVTNSFKKGKEEESITNMRGSSHVEQPGFTETHKRDRSNVDKHNVHEDKLGTRYTETSDKGRNMNRIRLRDGKTLTERGTSYSRTPGNGADVMTNTRIPTGKTENMSHKYIRGEDDTQLYQFQDRSKLINKIKKTDETDIFYVLRNEGNAIKTNDNKNSAGTGRQYTAKAYQGNDRVIRKKGICHDKKDQSLRSFHGNNDGSGQLSDSQMSPGCDSYQSYEVYQNDHPGSYQPAQEE